MSDNKMCTASDLIELNRRAMTRGLNRTADPNTLERLLDPDGTNILTMRLMGHNVDSHPIFHHRIEVLAKIKDSMQPMRFYLDIADKDWKLLTPVPDEVTQ